MEGILAGLGIAWMVALLVLAVLTILIPVSAYLCQKYLYLCLHELRSLNSQTTLVADRLAAIQQQGHLAGQTSAGAES